MKEKIFQNPGYVEEEPACWQNENMQTLYQINFVLGVIFGVLTCHRIFYIIVRYFKKETKYAALKMNRYAVLVAARNEAEVIGHLLESVRRQDYPAELVDIYVVADNCTDHTAAVAAQNGARVVERFNKEFVGKGYALDFLFEEMKKQYGNEKYDGYFVFDADNLLDGSYITEMNKVFSNGYPAVTSYRNTKNFGDSWVSGAYGLWFLIDSEYINYPKAELGISCTVSGTGFLFSDEILQKNGGKWPYHLMSEDLQISADILTEGGKIGYCRNAVLYDEQPLGFGLSITQRSRWMKGSMQVMTTYLSKILKGIFTNGSFSCYDLLMSAVPMIVLSALGIIVNLITFIIGLRATPAEMPVYFEAMIMGAVNSYLAIYCLGLSALVTEWKKIHAPTHKKILYTFGFPIFVLSFGIAVVKALFSNVEWKQIKHTASISISEMTSKED